MHNCKKTRKNLLDPGLNEPFAQHQLQQLLGDCVMCREEWNNLRRTLSVTRQALSAPVATEEFWPGYHSRLHAKLLAANARRDVVASWPARFLAFATSSIRLPVPVAVSALILIGAAFVVLARNRAVPTIPASPQIVVQTKTVAVPVVQEKIVERVVYVERKNHKVRDSGPQAETLSLAGFKPTDEVKLTIIKGSYQDEQ
jgi:hypothetical protein